MTPDRTNRLITASLWARNRLRIIWTWLRALTVNSRSGPPGPCGPPPPRSSATPGGSPAPPAPPRPPPPQTPAPAGGDPAASGAARRDHAVGVALPDDGHARILGS